MFPRSYFGAHYFAPRYFPESQGVIPPPPPPTASYVSGLELGEVTTLEVNVLYALPAETCRIASYSATGILEVSIDGTNFTTITKDTNNEFTTSATFIRSTVASSLVCPKEVKFYIQ